MEIYQLRELAIKFNAYLNGDTELFTEVNQLDQATISSLQEKYEDDAQKGKRPVNLLRYIILRTLEQGEPLTPESLKRLKEQLENRELDRFDFLSEEAKDNFRQYPQKTKGFFVNWKNPGSILFPLLYTDALKQEVNNTLDEILDNTISQLSLENVKRHKVDFSGPQHYGSGRVWGAIFPEEKPSHQAAYQLFFSLSHNGLEGGLYAGDRIPNSLNIDQREHFTSVDNLINFLSDRVDTWKGLNTRDTQEKEPHRQLEQFKVPLNQIFYGPPGTGKTYHTVSEAVRIVEELSEVEFEAEYADRGKLKKVFESYVSKGQIAFTTFHQSMGYEDFVEGIKPETVKQSNGDTQVTYEVQPGIFKRLSQNAEGYLASKKSIQETDQSKFENEDWENAVFYKMSLGDTTQSGDESIYEYCIKNNCVALGWGGDVDYSDCNNESEVKAKVREHDLAKSDAKYAYTFKLYLKKDNFIVITNGNLKFRAIGKVAGDYEFRPDAGIDYYHFRKVDWILKDVDFHYSELYDRQFSQSTLYKLQEESINRAFFNQFKIKKTTTDELADTGVQMPPELIKRNYVLIINEINRGNVSQIFGELITLLEEDKRKGNKEELSAVLPYSQEPFGIPNNLYLIGTMNTADRSVEALDTALRRRFTFREMPPQPDLLSPEKAIYNQWLAHEGDEDRAHLAQKRKTLHEFVGFSFDEERMQRIIEELEELDDTATIEEAFQHEGVTLTGIHLKQMLTVINDRIEKLLGKDHAIGHAYFMHIYQAEDPVAALQITFHKSIIPLLQEYFYGDYAKIGLILGDPFVKVKAEQQIGFASSFQAIDEGVREDYERRNIFTLTAMDVWKKEDFMAIYA